jgi:hypothetical protein
VRDGVLPVALRHRHLHVVTAGGGCLLDAVTRATADAAAAAGHRTSLAPCRGILCEWAPLYDLTQRIYLKSDCKERERGRQRGRERRRTR